MEAAILSSSSGVFIFIPELVSEVIFLDGQVKKAVEHRLAASESAFNASFLHFRFSAWLALSCTCQESYSLFVDFLAGFVFHGQRVDPGGWAGLDAPPARSSGLGSLGIFCNFAFFLDRLYVIHSEILTRNLTPFFAGFVFLGQRFEVGIIAPIRGRCKFCGFVFCPVGSRPFITRHLFGISRDCRWVRFFYAANGTEAAVNFSSNSSTS